MSKILNLGLTPKPNTFHYPVIKTVPLPIPPIDFSHWTHLIFTSQTAVRYWPGPWLPPLCIGPATASTLKNPLIAPAATQEGMIALISSLKTGAFLFPHSKRARPLLVQFLQETKRPHFAFPLYDTVLQKLEPIPNLSDFDEILFTSPSTVEGFLKIYGSFPEKMKLTSIGPITASALP